MLTKIKNLRLRKNNLVNNSLPTSIQINNELKRIKFNKNRNRILTSSLSFLIVIASLSVLITNYFMPIFRIYGNSMEPTLTKGEIVVALKIGKLKQGDLIAFSHNNKILIKRYIAGPGDLVDIDNKGNVYVNGKKIDEPYIKDLSLGNTDVEFPYQVPESRIFVMGDNRSISLDSRNTQVGCIYEEQIKGKIILKIWPFKNIKLLKLSLY